MRSVQDSFGPSAKLYGTSAIHNNTKELAALVELANPQPTDVLLDVATGAGNTALAFAPHCAEVIALDITPEMLAEVERRAKDLEFHNVQTSLANATKLPFENSHFDIVTNRLAFHHFPDVQKAVSEVHRVLKQGGKFLISDNYSPENDSLAADLDEVERLRDPSHHWSLKIPEWKKVITEAGFEIDFFAEKDQWSTVRMNFVEWMERIRTPAENRARLTEIFSNMNQPIAQFLSIEPEDGQITFSLPRFTLLAIAR